MDNKISILFYSRIAKKTKENLVPIYLRITIDGKRIDQSINRTVELSKWSNKAGKMKGSHNEARIFNSYLDALKNKVYVAEREMVQDGRVITFESFKEKWFGSNEKPFMLMEIFKQHNDQIKELVGKDYSPATYQRYVTSKDHTQSFLKWKYKVDDIDIKKLNYEFINNYAFWLKTKRNCNHNTAMKYLANFKKVVLICIKNGWLQRDPFTGFKLTRKEVERPFLTENDLQEMALKEFKTDRLTLVRDIFLFSCYTGLAYADVKKLSRSEVNDRSDAQKWIFTNRQKTGSSVRIPLLPVTFPLMEKYINHPLCINKDLLFPVSSNQKKNDYLKEIADICGINKQLTYHIARHTFATTVTLSNGVPIESVSKMLGF